VIGPDWVEQAYRTARAADATAKLYLNEFGADTANAAFAATEALARDFKARGVPLDGVGLQYHVYGREPFQHRTEEALRRIGALGLTAHVSELDSTTSPWEGWYRDGVEVRFADGGDAVLPDGSPGSGLNPTSVPAPRVISTTGTTVVSGAGKDRAGNASPSVSGTYRVDADAPVASARPVATSRGRGRARASR
jgi:hypothetical protein